MTYQSIINLLLLGFTSCFIGSLPLGMLNLTVLKMSLANQQRQAIAFSVGSVIVEFFQILVTLLCMNLLLEIPKLNEVLAIVSIPVLIYLGIKNLKSVPLTEGGHFTPKNAFLQGITLSFANVLIYPFWLLWGNLFVKNGLLPQDTLSFSIFALGTSLGSLCAFGIFVFIGKILWKRLERLQNITNRLIATAFLGFATFQLYAVLTRF